VILVLYLLCIGMFGVGVGMLYTPILVDRMQLSFPSGYAVANILRALTDPPAAQGLDREARRRHARGARRAASRPTAWHRSRRRAIRRPRSAPA
jgi:uncharacterized oligopeptide transporter (OPT) family protein